LPASSYRPRRQELAGALRALRVSAGLSGHALAQRLGWYGQQKVSKIEKAEQIPRDEEIAAWAEACDTPGEAGRLIELRRAARGEYLDHKGSYHAAGGAAGRQAEYAEMEERHKRIREYLPLIIPALLQTARYARDFLDAPAGPRAFGADDVEINRMVSERIQRQQRVLWSPDKQIQFVILEAALYVRLAEPGSMAEQLRYLLTIIDGLPALELTIIPFPVRVPIYPLAFAVYDDDFVMIETLTGEAERGDPDEIAYYHRWMDLLREAGVRGPEAAALIRRAIGSLTASQSEGGAS
jgi:transcriptional regulator with XRE-family HTH domain